MANEAEKAADDARKADAARRKANADSAKKSAEAARKSSEETLKEQANMKPVPSQEDADLMRAGAYDIDDAEEVKQPEGPAQRSATSVAEANQAGNYQTRVESPKK